MANDKDLESQLATLSLEVRAQFEQLLKHRSRYALPEEDTESGKRKSRKQVRYSVPPSWEDYTLKRVEWQSNMWRRVLKASFALLAEVGVRRFTVKEVAKRAKVARSTIYKHIGIKADLLSFCMHRFWDGGPKAHERGSERIAYRIVLDALADNEKSGPELAAVLADFIFEAARSPERDLWLLTAAETVRSVRPPLFDWPHWYPNPVRGGVRMCLRSILEGGAFAHGHREATGEICDTVLYALNAFAWYEATLNGPAGDDKYRPPLMRPLLLGHSGPLRRPDTPAHRRQQSETCQRAIAWLLQGAGLGGCKLAPLPPLPPNRLPVHVQEQHPTGQVLFNLRWQARQVDLDDREAILPHITPQSLPLAPLPRLPGTSEAAAATNQTA